MGVLILNSCVLVLAFVVVCREVAFSFPSWRFVPSRAWAYSFKTISDPPFVEEEWHLLLICPLYERLRRRIPCEDSHHSPNTHVPQILDEQPPHLYLLRPFGDVDIFKILLTYTGDTRGQRNPKVPWCR